MQKAFIIFPFIVDMPYCNTASPLCQNRTHHLAMAAEYGRQAIHVLFSSAIFLPLRKTGGMAYDSLLFNGTEAALSEAGKKRSYE